MLHHSLEPKHHLTRVQSLHDDQVISRTREVLVLFHMDSQNKWTGLELRPELAAFGF